VQPIPIAQHLLCRFLQSFPPGGLRLSHLPRQLVLPSLQQSGFRRIPAKYLMARPECNN